MKGDKMTDETNNVSGEPNATSGAMAFLLSLVTCGIYGFYWVYKQGERLNNAKMQRGYPSSNLSVIYLLLTIFGLGIVAFCLMQNELNEIIDNNNNNFYNNMNNTNYNNFNNNNGQQF